MEKLRKTRNVVDGILKTGSVRYGINTGFGILSKVVVPSDKLEELNYNIIRWAKTLTCAMFPEVKYF